MWMTLGASSIFEGMVEADYTYLMTVMSTSKWEQKLGNFSYDFSVVNTPMLTELLSSLRDAKG